MNYFVFVFLRFGRDKCRLSRKIKKICTNKFDDPFYSWSVVPTDRKERLFVSTVGVLFLQMMTMSSSLSPLSRVKEADPMD
ncbi:unnamed protein product [Brassica oleracea]